MFRIEFAVFAVLTAARCFAAPPIVEISDARPLFVFRAPDRELLDAAAYASKLVQDWSNLSAAFHDRSAYGFDISGEGADLEEAGFLVSVLGENGISASMTVANVGRALPIESLNELFVAHPNIVAIHAARLPIGNSEPFGGLAASEPAPGVRWLLRALDLCAAHGRFLSVELSAVDWLRISSDPALDEVYQGLRYYAPYAVLVHPMENPYVLTATGALMGLWLEGAGDQWGVTLSPAWYRSTDFVEPGVWGPRDPAAHTPPGTYRAMILAGAMGGATVYRFEDALDLWAGERSYQWAESIAPTLDELVSMGAIPRRDLVADSVRVAYQCGTPDAPAGVATILNETNSAVGDGALERIAYGASMPRSEPDLFPNRARYYLVPFLSRNASPDILQQFPNLVPAGLGYTGEEWTMLLNSIESSEPESAAAIIRVGRSVFVMHNRENSYERQTYRIPELPAPVRGVKARRTAQGVELTWPFREDDFAYTVYRRMLPELTFEAVARDLDERAFVDAAAGTAETAAYAITALTNESEPVEGAVNWGEYRIYSAAVSRIEEEVIVLPETEIAIGSPVTILSKEFPAERPLWPGIDGLSEEETETALEVAARIENFREAAAAEDFEFTAGMYAREYQGADGSNAAFAGRFFEGFFARYDRCSLFAQPSEWRVENVTEPTVAVTFYVELSGVEAQEDTLTLRRAPAAARSIARVKFGVRDGDWRIVSADAPFPSFADVAP